MKRITLIVGLVMAVAWSAIGQPTNTPVAGAKSIALDTNGVLTSPLNFFTTNELAIYTAISNRVASGVAGVGSFNGRTGVVTPATNDYTSLLIYGQFTPTNYTPTVGTLEAFLMAIDATFPTKAGITHASRHQHGGADEVATATPGANAIPKAGGGGTLAAGWLPAATTGTAGAITEAPSDGTQYARKNGAWEAVSGSSSATNATALSVNGTYGSAFNLNGSTPTPDPDYIAAEAKVSGTNLLIQVPVGELFRLNTNNTVNGDVTISGTLSVDAFDVGLLIITNLSADTLLGLNSTGAVVSFTSGNGISFSGTNIHTKLAGTNTSHGTIGLSTNADGTVVFSLTSVTGGGAGTNAFANVPSIYGTAYFETTADDIVNDVYTGHISGSGSHVGDSMTTMELTINFDETRADTDYIVLWEVDTLNDLDGVSLIITNKSTTGFRIISAPITTPGTQPNGYAYTLTVIDTQGQSIAVTFTNIVAGDATIDNLVVTGAASVGTGLAVVGGLEVTGGIIADSITAPFAIVTNLATNSFVVVGSAGIVTNLPVTASRVAGTDGSGIPTLLSTTGSGNVMRTRTGVKRYVPIPMGSWLPGNVLPSTIATNLPTGGPPSDAWVFADAATNRNIVSFTIPPQWDGGTVRLYLKAVNNVANGSSQNYVWAFDAWAAGDGDVLTNNTWGTQVYSTNTIGTVAQTVSAFSSPAITIGNSPVVLDTVWIRLARWGDNASDGTNTVRLIDAMLEYTESATEYGGLP